jgi:hypothetical protein
MTWSSDRLKMDCSDGRRLALNSENKRKTAPSDQRRPVGLGYRSFLAVIAHRNPWINELRSCVVFCHFLVETNAAQAMARARYE